ncbi:MAG: protease modulator HflC [Bradymonadaceae bacterium]|nr:protease modulator HflC [Lujinxingiaceae bacterium]
MKPLTLIIVVLAIITMWIGSSATFVVDENQQVVITQFGRPIGKAITSPGIYFKTPFVQDVHVFEKRFLEWNGDRNQVPTKDKRFIWVDCYARWRITDPLRFYQRVRDERGAQSRLDDIIDGETRNAVANHDLLEVVRSSNRESAVDAEVVDVEEAGEGLEKINRGRNEIMARILSEVAMRTEDLGIEVIDVRFKQINYNEDVRPRVYERMTAERQRIAQKYRSEGQGESARIRGEKERELQRIESEAFKTAEEIRGRADARATGIYAEAYNLDPEFYRFLKTMESYHKVLDTDSTLVLSTDSEFFTFLKSAKGAQ